MLVKILVYGILIVKSFLYGVDENSYDFVTRSKKSYKMVIRNIIEFLKLEKKNQKLKLDLIILF